MKKQKPNNSNEHTEDKSEMSYNSNNLVERLKNIIEINCNLEGKLDSVQFLIEDLLPLFIEEREKVLEEVREIIKNCYWISGSRFTVNGKQEKMIVKCELLSKINKLR